MLLGALTIGCTKTTSSENGTVLPPLTVGMMSAVDCAPFYYALQQGYYAQEGVDVQLILFTNAEHRQTALQTGQVDGAMTDLVALITHTGGDFALSGTLSTDGVFPLLANGPLDGKKSLTVGTMEISVTNYVLEQYLGSTHELQKVYINEIPARLEAVVSGHLDAGIFPEPFASVGALRNLDKIIYDEIPSESLNIMAFTETAIKEKEESIRKFHQAYNKAVKDLQEHPAIARDVLIAVIPNLSAEIRDDIFVPRYHFGRLPSDAFTSEIIAWTEEITGMQYDVTPSDLFDRRFIQGL